MFKSILLCAFAVALTTAVDFPKYFRQCSLSDPHINQCLVEQGNAAWDGIIKGDETYQIPKMIPELYLPQTIVNVTSNFQIYHTDVKIHSLANMKLIAASYDKTLNKFVFKMFNPDFYVTSKYAMRLQQFLGEDINGNGQFNMDILNSEYIVEVYLKTITRNGVEYYALEKSSFDFIPERMFMRFQGLFNGDVSRGELANGHINAHWMDYWKNVRTSYSFVMDQLTQLLFNAFMSKIPKNQFFLP